eukprot:scaffold1234_cov76-Phaeocystis_antarctica.AAC.4
MGPSIPLLYKTITTEAQVRSEERQVRSCTLPICDQCGHDAAFDAGGQAGTTFDDLFGGRNKTYANTGQRASVVWTYGFATNPSCLEIVM